MPPNTGKLIHLRGAGRWPARPPKSKLITVNHESWGVHDTQTGMPFRIAKGRKVRSKIRWFTEFCNSHYVSHFAAFFIDARAKRSVVESCINCVIAKQRYILHCIQSLCENVSPPSDEPKEDPRGGAHRGEMDVWGRSDVHNLSSGQRQPSRLSFTIMILPQVHLRKPCYDFYFL